MLRYNGEDPQILLFEDAELKTTYNMEDLTRQGKGGIIILIISIIIVTIPIINITVIITIIATILIQARRWGW